MRFFQGRRVVVVLGVGIGLILLSAVVDSPVTDALPNLFAGSVVLVVAYGLVDGFGVDRTLSTVTAALLGIGGLGTVYEGVVTLAGRTPSPAVSVGAELTLLAGLILFVYDWQFVRGG